MLALSAFAEGRREALPEVKGEAGFLADRLGPGSGLRGYGLAALGGIVTPAGPFAVFPILVGLRAAGAGFAVCVVYLTAWATMGLQRMIVWELPFLGFDFVGLRVLASLPIPILAGVLAHAVARRVAP